MNRMHNLAIWVLIGFVLIAVVGALRWIATECPPDALPGPTIGSVIKLWGC
jgi:hypothetical protein